jgi:hypothetical protein
MAEPEGLYGSRRRASQGTGGHEGGRAYQLSPHLKK